MLDRIFLSVLNMELTASYVILFVLLVRWFLKKQPKIYSYALWSIVLFRLICPFSFESVLSLIPVKQEPIPQAIITSTNPHNWTVETGVEVVDRVVTDPVVNPMIYETSPGAMAGNLHLFALLWLLGIVLLLLYSLHGLFKLRRRLRKAERLRENIYVLQGLETAFVLGLLHPKIYLPAGLSGEEMEYILLHEQTHLCRKDHLVKIAAFGALCIHWFNPLVWLAFGLSSQDMEMSCDEAVIRRLGNEVKKAYSSTLLSLAAGRKRWVATPLAFGEGDTKSRIKNVLNYKKPAFWLTLLLLALVLLLAIALMSNPLSAGGKLPEEELYRVALRLEWPEGYLYRDCFSENIIRIGTEQSSINFDMEQDGRSLHEQIERNAALVFSLVDLDTVDFVFQITNGECEVFYNREDIPDSLYQEVSLQAEELRSALEETKLLDYGQVIDFPNYDQRTKFNGSIFDIEPFEVSLRLPKGWTIQEGEAPKEGFYPLIGAWNCLGIYDGSGDCVGAVGYNIFDDGAESLGNPMAIYHQIALSNHYAFLCAEDYYQEVKDTGVGRTAITEVYSSGLTSEALGYGNPGPKQNWGILSYDTEQNVYVCIELDLEAVDRQAVLEIADSVYIGALPSSSQQIDAVSMPLLSGSVEERHHQIISNERHTAAWIESIFALYRSGDAEAIAEAGYGEYPSDFPDASLLPKIENMGGIVVASEDGSKVQKARLDLYVPVGEDRYCLIQLPIKVEDKEISATIQLQVSFERMKEYSIYQEAKSKGWYSRLTNHRVDEEPKALSFSFQAEDWSYDWSIFDEHFYGLWYAGSEEINLYYDQALGFMGRPDGFAETKDGWFMTVFNGGAGDLYWIPREEPESMYYFLEYNGLPEVDSQQYRQKYQRAPITQWNTGIPEGLLSIFAIRRLETEQAIPVRDLGAEVTLTDGRVFVANDSIGIPTAENIGLISLEENRIVLKRRLFPAEAEFEQLESGAIPRTNIVVTAEKTDGRWSVSEAYQLVSGSINNVVDEIAFYEYLRDNLDQSVYADLLIGTSDKANTVWLVDRAAFDAIVAEYDGAVPEYEVIMVKYSKAKLEEVEAEIQGSDLYTKGQEQRKISSVQDGEGYVNVLLNEPYPELEEYLEEKYGDMVKVEVIAVNPTT